MILVTALMLVFTPSQLSISKLTNEIERVTGESKFEDGFWGISIYSPVRKKMIYELNSQKNFRPASNMKIVTTLMAFKHLGPDYVFETTFSHTGTIEDGILYGDLIIQGFGDPGITPMELYIHWTFSTNCLTEFKIVGFVLLKVTLLLWRLSLMVQPFRNPGNGMTWENTMVRL